MSRTKHYFKKSLITFHPGTSFMITASSSRFSFSIRKVLKLAKSSVTLHCLTDNTSSIIVNTVGVIFGVRSAGSGHLRSCSAWRRGNSAILASISSICKRLKCIDTHHHKFQPDCKVRLWLSKAFISIKKTHTSSLYSTWKASNNQTPWCQFQCQTCYILWIKESIIDRWLHNITSSQII